MSDYGTIGFIGLGRMGIPILNNISRNFEVKYIFNRTRKEIAGHITVESPSDLGARCDLVFLMLSDTGACRSVIFGENGLSVTMKPGTTIVDLSTILPSASTEFARNLSALEIGYSDAPVIGSVKPAAEGKLTTIFGGEEAEFQRLKPIIASYSSRIIYMGQSGYGSRMKVVNNLVMGSTMVALAEGVALASAMDLDLESVLEALSSGGANSEVLRMKRHKISRSDFSPEFALKHQLKDVKYAVETANSSGMKLDVAEIVARLYETAADKGMKEEDFSAVLRLIRDQSGG